MNPAAESVTIVDENNQIIGAAPRREMREHRLRHRASFVLVFNARDELYVQRRTLTKDICPGFYDPAAGGVVLSGESCEESARRELSEELGISGVELTAHGEFYFEDEDCRVWGCVFSCCYAGPLRLQPEEVERVTLMTVDEVFSRAQSARFAPDSLAALRCYRERAA